MNIIPLCIKTDHELLSSLITIDSLIEYALKNNIKSLSICDTNLNGAYEFYSKCIKNDIKPIIGLNININGCNLMLYAKNYNGYVNLCNLSSMLSKGSIKSNMLLKYKDDLVCVLSNTNKEYLNSFSKIYEDIYLGEEDINTKYIYIKNINCIYSDDKPYLKYLNLLGDKESEANALDDVKLSFESSNLTKEIIDKCNVEIKYNEDLLPKYSSDDKEYLKTLSIKGLKKRLNNNVTKEYADRLNYELEVISTLNFDSYFLIVFDYVSYAKKNLIEVGVGRGSACGSLVAYSLGITEIDPLEHGLLFERFLNVDRITMPDIDIDFSDNRRDEVIDYVKNKYGFENFSKIVTYSTFDIKGSIRDISKLLDIPIKLVDSFSKVVSSLNTSNIEEIKTNQKVINFTTNNPSFTEVLDICTHIKGIKKNLSVHAAGVVISSKPLSNALPLIWQESSYLTGYTMNYLEDIGLLKMDFLGLKNLRYLHDMQEEIRKIDSSFKYGNVPLDDEATYALLRKGDTTSIFQLESDGMKKSLIKLGPTNFSDLVSLVALYRPGPMDYIDTYIKRKKGLEKPVYYDDRLEGILRETYGIFIYQEQLIQGLSKLANYSYAQSDVVRRAISKKNAKILMEEKEKFINTCVSINSLSKEKATEIFDVFIKFANYGFNKSHSVAYSQIAFQMAYIKANYPDVFNLVILNDNVKSASNYIKKTSTLKTINYASINNTNLDILLNEGNVTLGLLSIKDINTKQANDIINERKNKEFTSFEDFLIRTSSFINRDVLIKLTKSFVFNELNYNTETILNNIDLFMDYKDAVLELGIEFTSEPNVIIYDDAENAILAQYEMDSYGMYINHDPYKKYREKYNIVSYNEMQNNIDKEVVSIATVSRVNKIKTKKNEDMAFVTVLIDDNKLNLVIFKEYINLLDDLNIGDTLLIKGKVQYRNDELNIIISNMKCINI